MRKVLLSLAMLAGGASGWAQTSGTEMGLTRVGAADLADGMTVALQTVSTTNSYNWFKGAGAAGEFDEACVFVIEATGGTSSDGAALYYMRQQNASDDVAYLQPPTQTTSASSITMGAKETAAAVEFRPYSEQASGDSDYFPEEVDDNLTTRVTFTLEGTDTRLNCNGAGYDVRWHTGMASWSFWNFYLVTESIQFATVTYQCNFFDGSSDVTLEAAGLSDLIPSSVVDGTVTGSTVVGGQLSFPSFDNMTVRSATLSDGTPISDGYVLSESDLTDGALTVVVNYTSAPRITFHCTIDASLVGEEDGYYSFDTGTSEQDLTARYAVGETITAPAITSFTAVTEITDTASVSATYEVVYRPWRTVFADCYYLNAAGEPVAIQSAEISVDIDSLLTAPDLGDLYTFNAELTAEYGTGDATEFPFTVTMDNIWDGFYCDFYYDVNSPITSTAVTDDGQFPDDATWYIVRLRGTKIMTNETNDSGYLILDASAEINNDALWCFRQNDDDTYYVYNRAREGEVLCEDGSGTCPAFAPATGSEQGFELLSITTGYGFKVPGTDYVWNDLSNNTPGQLGYWENASAYSDAGSTITFEEYVASRYMFLDGQAILNAVDCVDGFTEEQVAELRGLVETFDETYQEDVDYEVAALLETPDEELVQYNPEHAYAIISGARTYISRDNVKYALYVRGDSTLGWKEFNAYDRSHYFTLGEMQDLVSTSGSADSTVCVFQSVESGKYVAATEWAYVQPLGMTDELVDSICYFHLAPAVAEYDEEGNETRAAVVAGFYITRWWYNENNANNAKVLCTMSMHAGTIDDSTEGTIVSYNNYGPSYSTVFRLYDTGNTPEVVGIGSVVNDEATSGDGTDAIYDLSGRRVQKATKGVYIQNGKKVYVK